VFTATAIGRLDEKGPSTMRRSTTTMIATATGVLLLDEATKTLARSALTLCAPASASCPRIDLPGGLAFVRVANDGSGFGFLQGWSLWIVLAVAGLLLVLAYARHGGQAALALTLGAGLQLGGAAGNLLDRMLLGGATDFISVGALVINLADVALFAGTLLAMVGLLRTPAPTGDDFATEWGTSPCTRSSG
jgi:signal peptidase II